VAHRVFVDAHGVEWQVWEVIPTLAVRELRYTPAHAPLPSELLAGWLAFQTNVERRRLVPIPSEWESKSNTELMELLAQAVHVADRRRLVE
jgi:hypothetical protein